MSVISNNLLMTPEGYQISRSVRLRSSASAYFNRTLGTPTDGKLWTWSGWVKRGSLGTLQGLQHGFSANNNQGGISFDPSGVFYLVDFPTTLNCNLVTTQVFRDPSAWYHIVVAVDTTQATASNRVKMYVNGQQITSFSTATYPTQNTVLRMVASGNSSSIGRYFDGTSYYFDGYLTEVNFIDGQALTPSSFGETDAVTGVWKPKKYAGTYGTNGFYLNFSDNSAATAAAIGKDNSGNGNNWTPNNISVTAGATYDSMLDVPTPYADGGNGRGNYAVLNPINSLSSGITVSGGNLNTLGVSASGYGSPATMLLTSGKWYFEVTAGSVASRYPVIGVQTELTAFLSSGFPGGYTANGFGYGSDGNKYVNNGAGAAFGSTFTTGDVVGVAIDIDAGKVWLAKNNTWQASGDPVAGTNEAYSLTAGTALYPCVGTYNGAGTHSANFGQRPFAYTPPTGFKALNTQNLPDSLVVKGSNAMNAILQSGSAVNNGANLFAQSGYAYGLVWGKDRAAVNNHQLVDTIRGTSAVLQSNTTSAETTYTAPTAGDSCVAWGWNSLAAGVSNTSGSITSTVSVNPTAGFSVVTYTGTGANATVGHGLGVAPKMLIVKQRGAVSAWDVYHASLGATGRLYLNTTDATNTSSAPWNNTAPTSSVFTVGTATDTNNSGGTLVAYCWSEVAGFSKFGSYTGNGSTDGPFVFTGLRARWLMIKRTDTAGNFWGIVDTARNVSNVASLALYPNSSIADNTGTYTDIVANGFKIRTTSSDWNASGATYIFAAFAENPFKHSLAR